MDFIPYQAGDMVYTDYQPSSKPEAGNPDSNNWPGDEPFNMQEQVQMLLFINAFALMNRWEGDQISAYRLMERVLREKLPESLSHKDAVAWIRANHPRTFKMLK